MNPLCDLLREVEANSKLNRLKLCGIDLSSLELTKVVADIMETNYSITHLNLCNSNI